MRTEKEIRDALLTIPDDETVENPCEMGHYAGYRNALEWVLEGKSNYRALLEEAVMALQQAYELNDYWGESNCSRWTSEIENNVKSILTRAKERLGQ